MDDNAKPDKPIALCDTVIELSERDRAVFFEALIDAPPMNERLKRAFAEHERQDAPRAH